MGRKWHANDNDPSQGRYITPEVLHSVEHSAVHFEYGVAVLYLRASTGLNYEVCEHWAQCLGHNFPDTSLGGTIPDVLRRYST